MKKKWKGITDFIYEHRAFSYPVIIIIAVAITVVFALNAGGREETESKRDSLESLAATPSAQPEVEEVKDTSLVLSENEELNQLMVTYYDAYANGDIDTIRSVSNYLSDTDELVITEMSKYITSYPVVTTYIKPGPLQDSYLAYVYVKMLIEGYPEDEMPGLETFYVCTNEEGKLYLNKSDVVSDEEIEYIQNMSTQDDVVELNNRVTAEFSDVSMNNAEMFYYVQEVAAEVKNSVGTILAQNHSDGETTNPDGETSGDGEQNPPAVVEPGEGQVTVPLVATATTTVNVRSSDSEKSEKIGKVQKGSKVEVVEQKVNGWSHIKYDNLDGYIKTEYLNLAEKIDKSQIIGQVTATSNVNVRQLPDQNSEKLGIISGGESIDLIERKDGWCKISYGGQVGYVKEDFVQ